MMEQRTGPAIGMPAGSAAAIRRGRWRRPQNAGRGGGYVIPFSLQNAMSIAAASPRAIQRRLVEPTRCRFINGHGAPCPVHSRALPSSSPRNSRLRGNDRESTRRIPPNHLLIVPMLLRGNGYTLVISTAGRNFFPSAEAPSNLHRWECGDPSSLRSSG